MAQIRMRVATLLWLGLLVAYVLVVRFHWGFFSQYSMFFGFVGLCMAALLAWGAWRRNQKDKRPGEFQMALLVAIAFAVFSVLVALRAI